MALETPVTYISDLVATNPVSASDNPRYSADHIRNIKAALLATFPNVNAAVTASDEELNFVDGVTSSIQTQIDARLGIPRSTTTTTLTTGDKGKTVALSAAITVPNATFAAGDAVSLYNDSAAAVTITQGASLTLRLAGSTSTGNRTLAARGLATIWFNTASEAIITGAGVT